MNVAHGSNTALHGAAIIAAVKAAGVEYVAALPDIVTSTAVLGPIAKDPDLRLIRVCKEDECIAIAAALSYCGKRTLVLIQHTGFLDSINAIRAIAVEFKHPIVMMIGLLSHESDAPAAESKSFGVRITAPILDAMGVAHRQITSDADVAAIQPAIENAYRNSHPIAFLIGRTPVLS